MERHQTPSSPLESSLTDLILKSKSEKIRRPPNAFMLFARDHRRLLSKQHPDVSNKAISSMLGKIWKNTSQNTKDMYYNKSKMLGELHKRRFPNYVYSPREARIQKMNKKRKKDEANSTESMAQREDLAAVMELSKLESNSKEEEWITDTNHDPKSSPEYVPNNPEYFTQRSPEINPEEDSSFNLQSQSECSIESQYRQESGDIPLRMDQDWTEKSCRWPTTTERCGCYNQNRLGSQRRCIPPCDNKTESEEVIPHFSDHLPYPCAARSPFCNPPAHFAGPMGSYCCGPRPCSSPIPRPYGPPLHPYWNPPMMNSACYPSREYFYDDLKPYPFPTSYHSPDFYRPPFGYFDRHVTQLKRNLNSGFHPRFSEVSDFSRGGQSDFAADNSVPYSYFGRSDGKEENVHCPGEYSSRNEDEISLRNRRILRSDTKSNEHFIHQIPVNGQGTKQQEALNSHMNTPIKEGRHLSDQQYQNSWDNHSLRDKITEMPSSIKQASAQEYQCDSSRSIGNKDITNLAGFRNDKTQTSSENVTRSAVSPESNSKINVLYAEDGDCVTAINPELCRLHTASESTRPLFWNSAAVKPSSAKNDIREIYDKPSTKLDDRPIYTSLENNFSVACSDKHLPDMTKTLNDKVSAVQSHNRADNIIEDKQAIPMNFGFFKAPVQMTKEYPSNFASVDLRDIKLRRMNQEVSKNVQQEFSSPVIKLEVNEPDMICANEREETYRETDDGENNSRKNVFGETMKMERGIFSSGTANQEKANSISRVQENPKNNLSVTSNIFAENTKVKNQNLAGITSNVVQTNKIDNFASGSRPAEENIPGFCTLVSKTSPYQTLSNNNLAPILDTVNVSGLQPFIKIEDCQNACF